MNAKVNQTRLFYPVSPEIYPYSAIATAPYRIVDIRLTVHNPRRYFQKSKHVYKYYIAREKDYGCLHNLKYNANLQNGHKKCRNAPHRLPLSFGGIFPLLISEYTLNVHTIYGDWLRYGLSKDGLIKAPTKYVLKKRHVQVDAPQ